MQYILTRHTDGRALLVNFQQRIVLSHFNFKAKVDCIRFSPDGRYVNGL